MAFGHYKGKSIKDPEIRAMFTREALLGSKWYKARLAKKQARDRSLWKKNVEYLDSFVRRPGYEQVVGKLDIAKRLDDARKQLDFVESDEYMKELVGTLGADPIRLAAGTI